MAWVFNSTNGNLSHDGELVTDSGWAGHDAGRNNPAMEADRDIGPIPRGAWFIGEAIDSQHLGPIAMPLVPYAVGDDWGTALGSVDATNTYGRGGFFIHGASAINPGESSHGCVILPRVVRQQIAAGDDRILQVV
jgi:Protein of unknown function (DUF2778)